MALRGVRPPTIKITDTKIGKGVWPRVYVEIRGVTMLVWNLEELANLISKFKDINFLLLREDVDAKEWRFTDDFDADTKTFEQFMLDRGFNVKVLIMELIYDEEA